MVLIVNPLGEINEIRDSSRLLLDGCFFVMVIDKVEIVSKGQSGSPEEESINPPSGCVSVLF